MSTHDCDWLGCDIANNRHAEDDFTPLSKEREAAVDRLAELIEDCVISPAWRAEMSEALADIRTHIGRR